MISPVFHPLLPKLPLSKTTVHPAPSPKS
jgi:hypothetical protein